MSTSGDRCFASDNFAGAHPEILEALVRANDGHAPAYGADELTARAIAVLRKQLGAEAHPFFVFNGTAANVLGLEALTRPHHAVLCAAGSHIDVDECGAPERFTGCKLIAIDTPDGKLTPQLVERNLHGVGDQHHVQPRVISITQSTEVGTAYTPTEIRALADLAHARGLALHMDGARLANAATGLGVSLRALTTDAGVDALSLGGTKNGLMFGEAVVLFNEAAAREFPFVRKQGMQLSSKMRFIAAQFAALFESELWLRNARHANNMARLLADNMRQLRGVELAQDVQANGVFARLPREAIARAQKECFFYVWNEERSEVRWMCSWDTTEADVERLVLAVRNALGA